MDARRKGPVPDGGVIIAICYLQALHGLLYIYTCKVSKSRLLWHFSKLMMFPWFLMPPWWWMKKQRSELAGWVELRHLGSRSIAGLHHRATASSDRRVAYSLPPGLAA